MQSQIDRHVRAVVLVSASALAFFPGSHARAQSASDSGSDGPPAKVEGPPAKLEEVVVRGIRKSMENSLNLKRQNDSQIDVITAEDVTKFPDVNVAESLSRLPGVTVDRAYAEGEKVSIYGVDSRLISTTLDGLPIASADWQTSQIDAGRSFNFSTVAPELVGSVEVYKSSQARLYEGGLGGTINIVTRKPLELKPNTLSLSATYNKNLRTNDSDPRVSLLYSWHNEAQTFGFLMLGAYNKTALGGSSVTVLGGYQNACSWWASANPIVRDGSGGCDPNGAFYNPEALPKVTSGPALRPDMLVPEAINQGAFIQNRTRKTGYGALQWRPLDDLELNANWLLMKDDYSNYSQSMYTEVGVGWDDTKLDALNGKDSNRLAYTSVVTNQNGIIGGTTSHMAVREDNYYKKSLLENRNYNLGMSWTPGRWVVDAKYGQSKATGGSDPEYFLNWYGTDSGSWSLGTNSSNLTLTTPLTDPTLFHILSGQQAGFVKTSINTDDIRFAKIDLQREVDWGPVEKVMLGGAFTRTLSDNVAHFYNTKSTADISMADLPHFTTPSSWIDGLGASGDLVSYADITQQATIDYSASHKDPGNVKQGDYRDAGNLWHVDEKDAAAYAQANFRRGRFHGDFGVRAVHTTTDQIYRSTLDNDPWYEEMVTQKQSYTKVLPALNTVYDLTQNQLLRFTAAKVMGRPGFKEMSGQIEFSINKLTGNGGNPFLQPYESLNLGTSYEWYFAKNGLFNVDVFYRGITNYIVMKTEPESVILPQQAVDACNTDLTLGCSPRSNPMTMLVTTPTNLDKARVLGISMGWQGDIIWGFGIATNVTGLAPTSSSYTSAGGTDAQGNPVAGSTAGRLELPYLSKWSYTIAPYYEKGPIQARLSYTWRSKYISSYAASGTYGGYSSENLAQYTDAWGELDGQISYKIIGDHLEAVFSAQNLLDKVVKPYTTGSLPLGWSKYGTRLSLGLTYKLN
jgi:iron complex outermembrane receptor protein